MSEFDLSQQPPEEETVETIETAEIAEPAEIVEAEPAAPAEAEPAEIVEAEPAAPTEAEPAEEKKPAKKAKKKKALIIGASAVGIIAIVVAIVLIVLANTPKGLLTAGIRNSIKALGSSEYAVMMEQVSNGGSIKIFMDLEKLLQGQNLPVSGNGYLKLYMNEEKEKVVLSVGADTSVIKNISANIYADKDSLVFGSDWLLGDKAFGLEYDNLANDFNNSVFGPYGAYSLGITIPDNFQEQLEQYENYYKDLAKIGKELYEVLMKTLEETAELQKEDDVLELGDKDVKTYAVSMRLDHDQLADVVEDMLDYMRKDKDFKNFVEDYIGILLSNQYYWMDSEEIVEMFFETLDEAKDSMDDLRDQMEEDEMALELVFHITKSGRQLIGLEVIMEDTRETIQFTIAAGPDLKSIDGIYFSMENGKEFYEGTYVVDANDKNEYEADLRIRANGEQVFSGLVSWDKKDGDLTIKATANGSTIAIRGTLDHTDKKTLLKLNSVEADGVQVEMGIGVELINSDKMPTTPEYTNILKMTEDEVAAIIGDLSTIFNQMAFGAA